MTTDAIVALIATGVVGMLGFFLRASFSNITSRLDRLEQGLADLLGELKAGNVTAAHNSSEISILRTRQHDLSNEIQLLKAIQNRCKHCRGEA